MLWGTFCNFIGHHQLFNLRWETSEGKKFGDLAKTKNKPWSIVASIVSREKCQYTRIQKLGSLVSGASFKAKLIELYDRGFYLVSQALAA